MGTAARQPQPRAHPHVLGCAACGWGVGAVQRLELGRLHPDHAHLEQHAALPREGQEVGHRVAHVLEEGCCDGRLCHAGHQLGEQERSVRPQTHSQPDAKDWTPACGQALWDPADPPAGTAPVSRSPGKSSHPAGPSPTAGCWTAAVPCREDTVPTHLRPPATHKAVPSVQSPGHEAHGPWGDPASLYEKLRGPLPLADTGTH